MKNKLLFLSHRIPFPPDKGDKIRSFHLLRHLASQFEIYLGAFVDDPDDWQYQEALRAYCSEMMLVGLNRSKRRLLSVSGFLEGEPLSLPYYRSSNLKKWVDDIVSSKGIRRAFVFSSTMAQYLSGPRYATLRRIADFCDIDSDKWRQYAQGKHCPLRLIYEREANSLLAYERRISAEFDSTLFVSKAEADLFRNLAPEARSISVVENGVDAQFFDPAAPYASPFGSRPGPFIVFTGAMDYWPNVDAVSWFANEIFPAVLQHVRTSEFWIVGSNPDAAVKALARLTGVHVTGRVPDVRPYLAHANVAVAPLRIARGTQNKILEALAMALPVVCTSSAASGLRLPMAESFRTANKPEEFGRAILELLDQGANSRGRDAILSHYSWKANLATVDNLLQDHARREIKETQG